MLCVELLALLKLFLMQLNLLLITIEIVYRFKLYLDLLSFLQFVELKGSVFKKFDKTNLFQVSCSDVRERFHLTILCFIVILQTMREYSWKLDRFWIMLPDCIAILVAEMVVDWIKHAFITRFNELNLDVYKDYTTSLAYDVAQTRQRHAFSDHSDLVARRMGFIPLPLGVVMTRVLISSIKIENFPSAFISVIVYVSIASFKILNSLLILGMACDLISQHKQEKSSLNSPGNNRLNSPLNVAPKSKIDSATSPLHPVQLSNAFSSIHRNGYGDNFDTIVIAPSDLSASAIFANSSVDLKNATLNEELLKVEGDDIKIETLNNDVTRSFPNIKGEFDEEPVVESTDDNFKRSESEPNLNITENENTPK